MSSLYRVLCLSHDPAIQCGPEWHNAAEALAAAASPQDCEDLANHAACDLLVGRYSYPLVEVACPQRASNSTGCCHTGPQWIDPNWLRILAASLDSNDDVVKGAVDRLTYNCWSRQRVERLRSEL